MKKFLIGFGIFIWAGLILAGFASFLESQSYYDLATIAIIVIIPSLIIYKKRSKKNNNVSGFEGYISLKYENNESLLNEESENNDSYDICEEPPILINCPVCNKEVSSQAVSCPNCGHPVASSTVGGRIENKTTNHETPIDYSSIVDYSNPTIKPIKGNFRHINGLNIAENAQCEVLLYPSGYEFKSGAIKFNLPKSKVIDVTVKTDREIQQQYVSSIGSAVGGAVLFGPLGAIIGGRAKKKSIKTYSSYLIITYKDGESIKYIGFDVTNAPFKAKKFESEFKKTNNTITRVDL